MKIKILAFLILLAGILHCPAPIPYVINSGSNNVQWVPPNGGAAATNYQWNIISNGIVGIPSTLDVSPNAPYSPFYPGLTFIKTNGTAGAVLFHLQNHPGIQVPGETQIQTESGLCFNPGQSGYGWIQVGVGAFPMEMYMQSDGFSAPRYNDGWTSNNVGRSWGIGFNTQWNATNGAGTLTNTVNGRPGIVGYANSATNVAPASSYPGAGDLTFWTSLPQYLSGTASGTTWSNYPGTEVFAMHSNSVEILQPGGLQIDMGSSGAPFNLVDVNGNSSINVQPISGINYFTIGGLDNTAFVCKDQFGRAVLWCDAEGGPGLVAGHGTYMNTALRIGDGQFSLYGAPYGLEVAAGIFASNAASAIQYSGNSNFVANWPTAPTYHGQWSIVTSNNSVYILTSSNIAALTWGATNKIAGP